MDRSFYFDLAASGRRLPVATHLVLHEQPDPEAILLDGARLAAVMIATARRFASPLALPIMDLTLEKDVMLRALGIAPEAIPTYHFDAPPSPEDIAKVAAMDVHASPRIKASCESLAAIAAAHAAGAPEVPVGMCIGPFSLMTKLMADPIVPIFMAGSGVEPQDDDVAMLSSLLELCEKTVQAYSLAQMQAGARAIFLCEPAANLVYFSPKQIAEGSSVYDDFVIQPNRRLKALFNENGVDLIFHDCGALTPEMIASFAALDPVILSLGSPVKLWEAEPLVPKSTVLYGNLPTKKFYSDEEVPLDGVPAMVEEIEARLKVSGHPYIIGSGCDVLSMPGYAKTIMQKVMAMTGCGCGH